MQGKAWKPHGSSTERAKGFPTEKERKEAQVFLKEPTTATFSERRDAKVMQPWLRSWRGPLTLDMFNQCELRHLIQFPSPKT